MMYRYNCKNITSQGAMERAGPGGKCVGDDAQAFRESRALGNASKTDADGMRSRIAVNREFVCR